MLINKFGIGHRIAVLVSTSVIAAVLCVSTLVAIFQTVENIHLKRQSLESTAFVYASAVADDISEANINKIQSVLRSISRVPGVLTASVYNAQDRLITTLGTGVILSSDLAAGDPNIFEIITHGKVPVTVQIVKSGQIVGTLALIADISDTRAKLFQLFGIVLLAAIVAAAMGVVFSGPLQKRIAAPIKSITNEMQRVRDTKDYSTRLDYDNHDEIGIMAGSFNALMADIRQRDYSLQQLAYFDPLTGLPNRVNFQRILEEAMKDETKSAAVALIDIDNFHAINDAMGHSIGDALLMDVAALFHSELMPEAKLARLGGDEFAIYMPNVKDANEAQLALAQILATLYKPNNILGHEIHTTVSAGVVLAPEQARTSAEIQRHLDLALFEAKRTGPNRVTFFRPEMIENLNEEALIVKGLRRALLDNEITPYFQPIVDLRTGQVNGFEALARWIDPERGFISPGKFIPIAEKSGLISAIGSNILRASCIQARKWFDEGKPNWTVAVNVSAAQMLQAGFIYQVRTILAETKLPPHLLCVELTESLFVGKSMLTVQKMLAELKTIGVRSALDDFGTGYSSLSYLEHLPFDKLKIDRAFVHGAKEGQKNTELLKGIISLAHGLGMAVVAEGAENFEEVALLKKLGADSVQGFAYAKATPADQAAAEAEAIGKKALLLTA